MKHFANIHYSSLTDPRLLLDIYVPENECCATLIWMHGGGLETGSRKDVKNTAEQLAAEGIAVVAIDYRMYPQANFPDYIEDAAEAVRWFFSNKIDYNLNMPLFIGGSSAGSYLAMMLCFDRTYLEKRGIDTEQISGYLFDAGQPTTHLNVLKYRGEDVRRCVIDEAAPLYHIKDNRPDRPLLILFSDDDMPCRLEQNQLLKATLLSFGYEQRLIDLREMKGYSHCAYNDAADKNGRNVLAGILTEFIRNWL